MQTSANLLVNPAAENGLTGWATVEGQALVIAYGTSTYPSASSPGPADRGLNFFGGGSAARTRLQQNITLPLTADIDLGNARFTFSGWLGGFSTQDDGARLSVEFLDTTGGPLGLAVLGPVTAAERSDVTGLFLRKATGVVPPGSRTARVLLLFTKVTGGSNDGYADGLSLTVSAGSGNLLTNPGAEDGLAGWSVTQGAAAVVAYGTGTYPSASSPGPGNRGSSFFCGGTQQSSRIIQTVTLPSPATIDAGTMRYDLQGWLGGWSTQTDRAQLTVTFVSASSQVLGTVVIGPVTAADRGNITGLLFRSASATVPAGSRTARAELLFLRDGGSTNDGYADAISLSLTPGSL